MKINYNFISNLKQMVNKRTLVNLYKDIELVTRVRISVRNCLLTTTQINAFLERLAQNATFFFFSNIKSLLDNKI